MFKLFVENTRIALGSIRSQILRTSLTVIIISIGIFALVGILTVVAALENQLVSSFSSMGANTFSISQYNAESEITQNDVDQKPNPIINYPEAKAFRDNFAYPLTTTSLSFTASSTAEVKYGSVKTDPEIKILGVDENFLTNKGLTLINGRDFNNFDITNNNFVCIIGFNLQEDLFKNENPIDKTIVIKGAKFKVIGLLKAKGATFGNNQDLRVIIPNQIARSMYSAPNINYELDVKIGNDGLVNAAVDEATLTMRRVRKLNPTEKDNFGIERSDDLLQTLSKETEMLRLIAWVIGIITVFGSSIALMNIMLVSVSERTREIGIRKSLGATRNTIAWQFFTETFVISQMGGFLGIILGVLLGFGIAIGLSFEFVIPWTAIISAFLITIVVTIFSGLYPAIKASKLDPIEALRYE